MAECPMSLRLVTMLSVFLVSLCAGQSAYAFTKAVAVTVDSEGTPFILDSSGSVWGYLQPDDLLEPTKLPILTNIKQIVPFAALASDGKVYTWDYGDTKPCDNAHDGPNDRSVTYSLPTEVLGLDNVMSISGAQRHFLALRKDGTVVEFGRKLAAGARDDTISLCSSLPPQDRLPQPETIPFISGAISIATDGVSDSVLEKDGYTYNWGWLAVDKDWRQDTQHWTDLKRIFVGRDKTSIYSNGYLVAVSKAKKAYYWGLCMNAEVPILSGSSDGINNIDKISLYAEYSGPNVYILSGGRVAVLYSPDRDPLSGDCLSTPGFNRHVPEFVSKIHIPIVDAALPIGAGIGDYWLLLVGEDGSLWKQ